MSDIINCNSCDVGGASGQWYSSAGRHIAHCKYGRRQWNTSEKRGREHRHYSATFPHRCLRGHGEWKGLHLVMLFWWFSSLVKIRFCVGVDGNSPQRVSRMLVDRVASATRRDWQLYHLFNHSPLRTHTWNFASCPPRVTATFTCIWSPLALSW